MELFAVATYTLTAIYNGIGYHSYLEPIEIYWTSLTSPKNYLYLSYDVYQVCIIHAFLSGVGDYSPFEKFGFLFGPILFDKAFSSL